MTWDSFCQWWIDLFKSVGNWFITPGTNNTPSNLARIIMAILLIVAGHYLIKLIMYLVRKAAGVKRGIQVDLSVKTFTISFIDLALRIALAILVLMILNVDFTSIAGVFSASLVAVGLALQNIIAAFVSGLILLSAKYFKSGDYIHLRHSDGECEGYVHRVSIITTQLKTFDGQTITVPNDKLTKGVVTNYTVEKLRRIVLSFTVDYSTDIEALKALLDKTVKADKRIVDKPQPLYHVSALNQHGVEISTKVWVPQKLYWDVKFDLTENILLAIKDSKIKIPYQKIRITSEDDKE